MTDQTKHHGLLARLNAWFMDGFTDSYNERVGNIKRELLGVLSGRVLEIGPGTGANLEYYSKNITLIGLEPNPYMQQYFREKARSFDINYEIITSKAEDIPLADSSVDAVVSTLVLCSVDVPEQSLREIRRVLKPGGSFIFIEHVAAPEGTLLRKVQRLIRPLWKKLAEGCHTDRETGKKIRQVFNEVQLDSRRLPFPIVGPHIMGRATKSD